MENQTEQKISYRVSLLWIIILLLGLIFLGFFLQGYFNLKLIEKQNIETNIQDAIISFLVSDILFFFLITVCFFVLFKIIIKPIGKLKNLCAEVRKGKLVPKKIQSDIIEVDQLIVSFNRMIEDLMIQRREIEKINSGLEKKVTERTKELEKLTAQLEEKIQERTKELSKKIVELEKFHQVAVGRELKMIELKKEIKTLNEQSGAMSGV